jgi:hypothetical protein
MFRDWRPYVPVALRRHQAALEVRRLGKTGQSTSPVIIEGRTIARTFWGKAWCENLERYSDFANRLPRGRTYVRNGSVIDLRIAPGEVKALVSGSSLYRTTVRVTPVPAARWRTLCADCAGGIDSLVELLQGRFARGVMERLCQARTGLFPSPAEITLDCSCPDWAAMCKHVAAVLYGVGTRLDAKPELLFALRGVDEKDLITHAGAGVPLSRKGPAAGKVLAGAELSEVFGIELAGATAPLPSMPAAGGRRARAGGAPVSVAPARAKARRAGRPARSLPDRRRPGRAVRRGGARSQGPRGGLAGGS